MNVTPLRMSDWLIGFKGDRFTLACADPKGIDFKAAG